MRQFDVLIVGGGQAAFPLAGDLLAAGRTVAIAERKHLGGSCVNFGCTPTKAVLASAMLAHDMRRAGEFGLHSSGVEVHFASVLTRARGIVQESREGLNESYGEHVLRGHARLISSGEKGLEVEVGGERVLAETVVLDTGTRSAIPNIPGLTENAFLHAGNWLDQTELPERLAILGGGVVAMEMAQFYQRMGSKVTIFEQSDRVLPHEEPDVSAAVRSALEGEKVRFVTGVKIERREPGGRLMWMGGDETFDQVFVATGRTPNTQDVGLKEVGVEVDERGYVRVGSDLRSSNPKVFAVGDIRGGMQFTHTSWDDYRVVKSQLLGDGARTTAGRVVPYVVFTDPELGRVGPTESELRAGGQELAVGRFDMTHNGLARERRQRAGFIQVLADPKTHRLLGATVFARGASELIELFASMIVTNADYRLVRDSIVSHPTLMEAAQSALEAIG